MKKRSHLSPQLRDAVRRAAAKHASRLTAARAAEAASMGPLLSDVLLDKSGHLIDSAGIQPKVRIALEIIVKRIARLEMVQP